jgi:hypothetical protein
VRTVSAAACAAAVALLLVACGGSDDGGAEAATADLARFAPADAVAFGQVAVHPEADLKETVESILERFPNGDKAGAKLIQEIDEDLADDELTYRGDIEPWLGEHAGAFVTGFDVGAEAEPEVDDDQAVILVETTDEDLARQTTFDAARRDGRVRESTYKGVELVEQFSGANQGTFAVFDGVLAASGGPAGVHAAIDASRGESLEGNQDLDAFLGDRQGDNMGVGYLDVGPVIDAYEKAKLLTPAQREAIAGYGLAADEPLLAALDAGAERITLELAGASAEGADTDPASELIEDVPDDAWLALGFGDVGRSIDLGVAQLGATEAPDLSTRELNRMLRRQVGITLDDLESVGDFAAYASGESIFGLEGGAVVEAREESSAKLLDAIRRAAVRGGEARIDSLDVPGAEGFSVVPEGLPASINFAFANERLAAAVGDEATERLLEGEGGSEAVAAAQEALGGDDFAVAFLLRFEPLLELLDSVGSDDPDLREARPYLQQISRVAAGFRIDDEQSLVRFVVELED